MNHASEGRSLDEEEIELEEELNENEFEGSNLDTDAILKLEFDSLEDAEVFYNEYSFVMGFNFRRCSKGNEKDKLSRREWECSCAGERRERDPYTPRIRKETKSYRCNCKGYFRVALDKGDNKYKVTTFRANHNHDLVGPEDIHKLKGFRFINEYQKVILGNLQRSGVRPCQAIKYLEELDGGGPGCFAYRKKDFYNYFTKKRQDTIRAGDVETALHILEGMKLGDRNLAVEITCDSDEALSKLFWCDGFSRAAFGQFSDVLVMDSTYNTNMYRFPLVIFSGIDNHFKSTVLGSALLSNETTESYVWLFRTFLKAMGGKAPAVILTDQDEAMRAAIQIVFPHATHRLCSWHLNRNCLQRMKVAEFRSGFARLMVKRCTVGEFETKWKLLTEGTGVDQDSWVKDIFGKRHLWAEAYFSGRFMARSRTTQREESLNLVFKQFGRKGSTITEFLGHYFDFTNEMKAKFRDRQRDAEKEPSHVQSNAPLYVLQRQMATKYTPSIMKFIEEEVGKEKNFIVANKRVVESTGAVRYSLQKYGVDQTKTYSVLVDLKNNIVCCNCEMMESDGIPCRHIFCGLKNLNIHSLPNTCVRERWTTEYGSDLKEHCNVHNTTLQPESSRRHVRLTKECEDLCRKASQTDALTNSSLKRLRQHKDEIPVHGSSETDCNRKLGLNRGDETFFPDKQSQKKTKVRDPKRIQGRGAPKYQTHKCGNCGDQGHKSTTCQKKKGKSQKKVPKRANKTPVPDENISTADVEDGVNSEGE